MIRCTSSRNTILFLFSFSVFFCLFTNKASAQNSNWKKFKCENISFSYPPDWELKKGESDCMKFTLFAAESRASIGDNINIISTSVAGMDLDQYVALSIDEIITTTLIENVELEKRGDGTTNGFSYMEITYTGEFSGIKMKWLQRIFLVNGTAVILTFTGKPDTFDEISKEAKTIFETLKIK